MKLTVILEVENAIKRKSVLPPTTVHDFIDHAPLSQQLEAIALSFPTQFTGNVEDYCLQTEHGTTIDESRPLSFQLATCESGQLIFCEKPALRAQKTLALLKVKEKVKDQVFCLRSQLEDTLFAREFIKSGGIPILLDIAMTTTGNTQSYSLAALHVLLSHLNGLGDLITPELIKKLYTLTSAPQVGVVRHVLEILVFICTFEESGGSKIRQEVKLLSEESNEVPYTKLSSLVKSGDLDTQINALTLINSLWASCNSDTEKDEFKVLLETKLEFSNLLSNLRTESEPLRNQIRIYGNILGQQIVEGDSKKRMKDFTLPQPLYHSMRKEISRTQRKFQELLKFSEFLPNSSRLPLQQVGNRIVSSLDKIMNNSSLLVPDSAGSDKKTGPKPKTKSRVKSEMKAKSKPGKKLAADSGVPDTSASASEIQQLQSQIQALSSSLETSESNYQTAKNQIIELEAKFSDEKQKQEQASANVKKLAQVVKLMKVKYDSLKEQIHTTGLTDSPRLSTREGDLELNLSSGSSDPASFRDVVYNQPLQIAISEEIVTSVQLISPSYSELRTTLTNLQIENQRLRQENESLHNSLENAASLDTMANLMIAPVQRDMSEIPSGVQEIPPMRPAKYFAPTKPKLTPSIPKLALPWNKIVLSPHPITESFWSSLKPLQLNLAKVDELFPSDSNNLDSFEFPPYRDDLPAKEQILEAVQNLDSSRLNFDQLKTLYDSFPSEPIVKSLHERNLHGIQISGHYELIHLITHKIPHAYERVKCWYYLDRFPQTILKLESQMDLLDEVCQQLKESQSLRDCLTLILEVGNYLNAGSYLGQADGFFVNSLRLVLSLQSMAESFPQFLASQLKEIQPGFSVQQEISLLQSIQNIQLEQVLSTILALKLELDIVDEYATAFTDKVFQEKSKTSSFKFDLKSVYEQFQFTKQSVEETLQYFATSESKQCGNLLGEYCEVLLSFLKALSKYL